MYCILLDCDCIIEKLEGVISLWVYIMRLVGFGNRNNDSSKNCNGFFFVFFVFPWLFLDFLSFRTLFQTIIMNHYSSTTNWLKLVKTINKIVVLLLLYLIVVGQDFFFFFYGWSWWKLSLGPQTFQWKSSFNFLKSRRGRGYMDQKLRVGFELLVFGQEVVNLVEIWFCITQGKKKDVA